MFIWSYRDNCDCILSVYKKLLMRYNLYVNYKHVMYANIITVDFMHVLPIVCNRHVQYRVSLLYVLYISNYSCKNV